MRNLHLYFAYPWFLLLFILAFALTLIPYFKLAKRYRRTRNRITSMVLHLVVIVLSILAFAGLEFRYQIPNEKNEIILLVDVSDTEAWAKEKRENFIQEVLDDCKHDGFNVGIVTFGFDQEYAVPLTHEIETVYNSYLNATLPDTSATNIAGALEYTKTLFNHPETSKIVLITDGKETDKQMTSVVRAIAAQGTKIDVAYIGSNYGASDIQILGVEYPNHYINQNEECTITLQVQSSVETTATFELYDNGEIGGLEGQKTVTLKPETQPITFKHKFMGEGLHEMRFSIVDTTKDTLANNSQYTSYIYIDTFNEILIIEKQEGTSTALVEMLNAENEVPYQVTIKGIGSQDLPYEVDELRKYDQIIMNNISNKSLPDGFVKNLHAYVADYGGGLFTVGGDEAYSRKDMYGTAYQEMLPVQAIDYTPPVAVMLVIDRSGSMAEEDNYGNNMLDWAKAGAFSCIDLLTERDYIGIMTLDTTEATILDLTPQPQRSRIASAINSITEAGGGTVLTSAVDRAGKALRTVNVARRHIIVITDGGVSDMPEHYENVIKGYREENGTTLSIVGVNMSTSPSDVIYKNMKQAAEWGGGQLYVTTADQLIHRIGEDLTAPAIKQVNHETFNPIATNLSSPLWKNVGFGTDVERNRVDTTLNGFYGVKARPEAEMVMVGNYNIPIYAQWEYGNGMVGSFMCDLQKSEWSTTFMASSSGKTFIRNVVNNLMPSESIRPSQISYSMTEDNYTNQLSVFTNLKNGEYIKGELIEYVGGQEISHSLNEVTQADAATLRQSTCYVTAALSEANDYSRCDFIVRKSGVYKIRLSLCDKDGNVLKNINGENIVEEMYKSFAYSEEYDLFSKQEGAPAYEKLQTVVTRGNGVIIKDLAAPVEVVDGFETQIDKVFDPRILFMIIVIVLFLADVAVRKFKFKWPHEIIREYREKKLK